MREAITDETGLLISDDECQQEQPRMPGEELHFRFGAYVVLNSNLVSGALQTLVKATKLKACEVRIELVDGEFMVSCMCSSESSAGISASMGVVWDPSTLAKALRTLDCRLGPPPYTATRQGRVWRLQQRPTSPATPPGQA
jgi:hypothetical protein